MNYLDHHLMVSFGEKAKIKKAGNLNKVVVILLQLYARKLQIMSEETCHCTDSKQIHRKLVCIFAEFVCG